MKLFYSFLIINSHLQKLYIFIRKTLTKHKCIFFNYDDMPLVEGSSTITTAPDCNTLFGSSVAIFQKTRICKRNNKEYTLLYE